MKNCPQCGQQRQGETYKCPSCDVFYSQLDELLYEEQQKLEQTSFKGRFKRIKAASDHNKAFRTELKQIWQTTPLKTKITFWTILAFIFVLVVPIF